MNVIFLLCDTLVRGKISPYHRGEGLYGYIQTPDMDRLAQRSIVFDNHWINSAPCMPARRDLFSGRIEFPWRSWGPRESFDPDWCLKLRETDVNTCLFTDHANLFDTGAGNYHHFFDSYTFVRGHFNDHCAAAGPERPGRKGQSRRIYSEAAKNMDVLEKTFVYRNMYNVSQWLEEHHASHKPFFLFVDEFDPHWPLDPPEPYRSMYLEDKALLDKKLSGFYKSADRADYTEEEFTWLKAQYEGKITMVDKCLGMILDKMDRYDLWKDTMLIFTTDHGEFMGEYNAMSKGESFSYPLFAGIPLIIHYPGSPLNGRRVKELTCTVDLNPTVLNAFGLKQDESCHGISLIALLKGEKSRGRNDVVYGWWGKGFYWTDGNFLLCKAPEKDGPLYQYGTNLGEKYVGLKDKYFDRYEGAETGAFMPHTRRPVYRVPSDGMAYSGLHADFDALFDLKSDPDCANNLYSTEKNLRNKCIGRLVNTMKEMQVPEEHYERLGLEDCESIRSN